jgi:hypothetical protein
VLVRRRGGKECIRR